MEVSNSRSVEFVLNADVDGLDYVHDDACTQWTDRRVSKAVSQMTDYLKSPDSSLDQTMVTSFLSKADALGQQFDASGKAASFKTGLAAMKELFQSKLQSPAPQAAPATPQPDVAKQKLYLRRINQAIQSLDAGSPRLKADIDEIKRNITLFRGLPGNSEADLQHLEEALNVLSDPSPLGVTPEEGRFVSFLCDKYAMGGEEKAAYLDSSRQSTSEGQSLLVKQLKIAAKEGDAFPRSLTEGLQERCMLNRFKAFQSAHSGKMTCPEGFVNRFPNLVNLFTSFTHQVVRGNFERRWEAILESHDMTSGGRFSELIPHYSYMDPSKHFGEWAEHLEKQFVSNLPIDFVDQASEVDLKGYLAKYTEAFQKGAKAEFSRHYDQGYKARILWLAHHASNVKKPYNQGDADNTNLGAGVCYANSLSRSKQLHQRPGLPSEEAVMGSEAKTRYHQAAYGQAHKEGKKTNNYQAFLDAEKALPDKFDLKLQHKQVLGAPPQGKTPAAHLMGKVREWKDAGHPTSLVLVLRDPGVAGHAVNLQFDSASNQFRMMDDNIGLVEFKDFQTMEQRLTDYFERFYGSFTEFVFESYEDK